VSHPNTFDGPLITEVGEYDGASTIRISPTQLGIRYTATRARKIVDAWCEFLGSGPTPILRLAFTSRTPKRLFASLTGQTQLKALGVKWGDYEELAPIAGMRDLEQLFLGGASSFRTLGSLVGLRQLRSLEVEGLRHVRDLSPLGELTGLRSLDVGGDWMSPRIAHVDSIAFLRGLQGLERLVLHTIAVDDLDYSPLLDLHNLRELRVARVRGMHPSHDELSAAVPALEPLTR
jgi:hypothetical protein